MRTSKTLLRLSIMVTLIIAATTAAHAQCSQLQTQLVQCGGPNNCHQAVPINTPLPAEYGFYMTSFLVYCCNSTFDSFTEAGQCEGTHEYAPISKASLAAAASVQPLLIRNCAGGYDPYVEPPQSHFDVLRALDSTAKLVLN
jgi:hypothetical protein